MNKKILIFTATYNESENIKNYLNSILDLKIELDILIIDDNSPDNTWKIIQDYSLSNKNIILVKRKNKEGLDTAHKYAYNFAKDNNYNYLITMDADLSHDPKIIPTFIDYLEVYPFVIGSRYVKNGKNETKFLRFFLSYMGNKFIKFVSNINCNEFTTSYRGFDLDKLEKLDLKEVKAKGYSFFMETLFLIKKNDYEIKEFPIIFKDRTKGVSKIPKTEILRTLLNLFLLKINNKN